MAPSTTPRTSTAADGIADAKTATPASTGKRGRPAGSATKTAKSPSSRPRGRPPLPASERKPKPTPTGRGRGRPPLPPGERKTKPYVPTGRPRGYGIQKALEKRREMKKKKEEALAKRVAGVKAYHACNNAGNK